MKHVKYRVGKWLPSDRDYLQQWIKDKIKHAQSEDLPLRKSIKDLRDAIYADPILYMSFTSMYDEIPQGYNEPVKNFETMLMLMNQILHEAPAFSVIENEIGLIGFPINAILDWAMGTQGGYLTFLHPVVNQKLEVILKEWSKFLESKKSTYVLTDKPIKQTNPDYKAPMGWLTDAAFEAMAKMDPLRGIKSPEDARENFIFNFKCHPKRKHFGFRSWDEFFTREFRKQARSVSKANRHPDVIVNACESAPYNCVKGAKMKDKFWMKGQPYSVADIMNHHKLTKHFYPKKGQEGPTVYQAFLSAKSYHRWNSPIDGTVVAIENVPGTYYAESPIQGYDPAGPNDSQGYIAEIATRALIFMKSDNKKIGLMCFVAIGMAEVSSCGITVKKGDKIKKGDPIGSFHFGGSTHCLIFRPGVDIDFDFHNQTPSLNTINIPVMSKIGVVK